MSDQDQGQAPAASIEERVANVLFPKEEPKQEEVKEEPTDETPTEPVKEGEPVEETTEEIAEKPNEDINELEWDNIKDAKIEVTVQGEKSEVSLEEARLGYMRTSDYQKKTQELSQQRKQVVDEATDVVKKVQDNFSQQLDTLTKAVQKLAMQELGNVDLNWLSENDPNAYIKYQHRSNQFNQVLQSLQTEVKQVEEQRNTQAQTVRAQMLEQGMTELKSRIPDYSKETEQALIKAGTDYGFKQEELAAIIDPRILHVLNDARQFKELKATKPQILKKAQEAPKIIKPGAKPAIKSDDKGKELRDRIKKTGGKDEDALTAFIKRTMR